MKGEYSEDFIRALDEVLFDTVTMFTELVKGKTSTIMMHIFLKFAQSVADMIEQLEKEAGE